jgi:hypothetical protein
MIHDPQSMIHEEHRQSACDTECCVVRDRPALHTPMWVRGFGVGSSPLNPFPSDEGRRADAGKAGSMP